VAVSYKVGEYYNGENHVPVDGFRLSPSGVGKFFSAKRTWYGENLLGEDKRFTSSTSTVLGTVCHHACEVVARCKIEGEEYNSEKLHAGIEAYIAKYDEVEGHDTSVIRNLWKGMAELLIIEHVLQANTVSVEEFIAYEITEGVYPSGTYDAITSSSPTDTWELIKEGKHTGMLTVRDFKTATSKPRGWTSEYTQQAFTYAYILHQQGIKIDQVELCFVVRPTKTLPARVFNFTKPFDSDAYDYIEGVLKLVADSVTTFKEYPACRYLLAGDYRLREED